MTLIRKPLPEDFIKENGLYVAFYDNLRVEMNDETKIDEPVLDAEGNKIHDLYVMLNPNDNFTKMAKLAEDSVKKANSDPSFEGKTSIMDGYGETRLLPLTKFYKKAYEVYLQRKNQPAQLSEEGIELARIKTQLAELQAKQVRSENEAPQKPIKAEKAIKIVD